MFRQILYVTSAFVLVREDRDTIVALLEDQLFNSVLQCRRG